MTGISYPQVAERLFNRPLLMTPDRLLSFLAVIGPRLGIGGIQVDSATIQLKESMAIMPSPVESVSDDDLYRSCQSHEGIAYIPIEGVLVNKSGWMDALCGLVSYEYLREQIDVAAADPAIKAIFLDIDTGGGEVSGCFPLADRIREVAAQKPVWAALSDSALSAGYALAAAAGYIFIPRLGDAGGVGVWTLHWDHSRALDERGMTPTLISAGAHKVDGNPFEPLPDAVRSKIQKSVDETRQVFAQSVARHRGMSVDDVLATEARSYTGSEAVEVGFADAVADRYEAFDALLSDLREDELPNFAV